MHLGIVSHRRRRYALRRNCGRQYQQRGSLQAAGGQDLLQVRQTQSPVPPMSLDFRAYLHTLLAQGSTDAQTCIFDESQEAHPQETARENRESRHVSRLCCTRDEAQNADRAHVADLAVVSQESHSGHSGSFSSTPRPHTWCKSYVSADPGGRAWYLVELTPEARSFSVEMLFHPWSTQSGLGCPPPRPP